MTLARLVESVDVDDLSWEDDFGPSEPASDAFAELTAALVEVQEAFTRSRPDAASASAAAAALRATAKSLRAHEVGEDDQLAGRLWSRAGRGSTMAPAIVFDEVSATCARGHFTIERFHSGRYALNGGVTPMIFDEIMSRLGNAAGRVWARTANLTVDYRAPAPLHTRLTTTAEYIRQDGRKRYLRGTITHGNVLIAEATGLWVQTRPDRPRASSPGPDRGIDTDHGISPDDIEHSIDERGHP